MSNVCSGHSAHTTAPVDQSGWKHVEESDESDESGQPEGDPYLRSRADRLCAGRVVRQIEKSEESHTSRARSGGTRGRTSRTLSERRGATHESDGSTSRIRTASAEESVVSGPVGATRRTTAERVESTVELCRSDKSTFTVRLYTTRVGPRRVASGRAWTWLMSLSYIPISSPLYVPTLTGRYDTLEYDIEPDAR